MLVFLCDGPKIVLAPGMDCKMYFVLGGLTSKHLLLVFFFMFYGFFFNLLFLIFSLFLNFYFLLEIGAPLSLPSLTNGI